jgi:hypothetical protein
MSPKRIAISVSTALVCSAATLLVDYALSPQLGFLSVGAMPYAIVPMLLAFAVSPLSAFVAAIANAAILIALVPAGEAISLPQRIGIAVVILATYAAYRIYARVSLDRAALAERRVELDEQNRLLQIQATSGEENLQALYNRLAVESRTITMLAELLPQLYSFNRSDVLDATLAAATLLSGAETAALYRFDEASLTLTREATRPLRAETIFPQTLDVASSTEGWVVRTARFFSLKYVLHDEGLAALHQGRTTIAVPVSMAGRVWGVLSVGEIPFLHYNQYAERSLQIVAALAVPGLEQSFGAVREEPARARADGGENRSMNELYADLQREFEEEGLVSVFLIDLGSNAGGALPLGDDGIDDLVGQVGRTLTSLTGGAVRAYRYQLPHQLALITVNQGFDAASYFLLRILEAINGRAWTIEGETILPRAIIGFASSNQVDGGADEIIARAESMLVLQRQAGADVDGV